MKNNKLQLKIYYLLLMCLPAVAYVDIAKAADSNLNMVFTTTNAGGSYGSRHVHVVWIEDSGGNFVYTAGSTTTDNKRALWAKSRASSLKEWWNGNSANRSADVDARTGATQTAYKTYNLNWNWRKKDGTELPDGNYQVHFLCTNADSGTPNNKAVFNITKGPNPQTVGPVNQGGYNNVTLKYTPGVITRPVVETAPASNISANSARLNAAVTDTGGQNPSVYIYWGDEDGSNIADNWDNVISIGTVGEVSFYTELTTLNPETTYYYRAYAQNPAGGAWASATESFTTFGLGGIYTGYKTQSGRSQIIDSHLDIDIAPVNDMSRAFVLISYGTGWSNEYENSNVVMVRGSLLDKDTIRIQRASSSNSTWVSWQVIECFGQEFTVYRSSGTLNGDTGYADVPIGGVVNPANCFAWVTADSSAASRTNYNASQLTAVVNSPTQLRIQRSASGTNVNYNWFVVEFGISKIASIQHGSGSFSSPTFSSPAVYHITPVNLSSSILLYQIRNSENGLAYSAVAGQFASDGLVKFYQHQGSSGTRNVEYYVIDFGPGASAQRGTVNYSENTDWLTADCALSSPVDISSTLFIHGQTCNGTGDYYPRTFSTARLIDNSTLQIERKFAGQQSYIEWQVTELPPLTWISTAAQITIVPEALNFGPVAAGSNSQLQFEIMNTGTDDLTVKSLEITGLSKSAYSITSAPAVPFNITASNSVTITVRFEPTANSEYNYASVMIANNDKDSSLANLPLSGTGTLDAKVSLSVLSGVGGTCKTAVPVGSNIFVGQGAMLTILDASNPSDLKLTGQVRLSDIIQDIEVVENTAYVAIGASGMQVVDVTNLTAPIALAVYDTAGHSYDVASTGSTLCIADGRNGLLMYDISSPKTPVLQHTCPTFGSAKALTISAATAIVLDDKSGLQAFDLANPISMTGYWKLDGNILDNIGNHEVTITGNPVWSDGKFNGALSFEGSTYIKADNVSADIAGGNMTLSVWVKSDPTTLQQFIASFNTFDGGNKLLMGHPANSSYLQVHDGSWHNIGSEVFDGSWHHIAFVLDDAENHFYVYVDGAAVSDFSTTVSINASDLFTFGQEYDTGPVASDFYTGLLDDVRIYPHVLNLSQIQSLYNMSSYVSVELGQAFAVSGTKAYVTDQLGNFFVLDITDPAAPSLQGRTRLAGGAGNGTSIAISGGYAYVTNSLGFEVIDVSVPSQPKSVGFVKTDAQSYGIAVSGQNAFLAAGSAGLITLDLTDAVNPITSGAFTLQANSMDVTHTGPNAEIFSADSELGLGVFALSDNMDTQAIARLSAIMAGDLNSDERVNMTDFAVLAQSWLTHYSIEDITLMTANWLNKETVGQARDIVVSNGRAYIASGLSGLKILDISSPSSPQVIGYLATEGFAQAVAVSGTTVLVSDGSRVYILNADSPEAPTLRATYHSNGWAGGIAADNSYGYVANGGRGITVINLSDASQAGSLELPGVAYDIAVYDGVAYVAAGSAGLQILDLSKPVSPSVLASFDTPGMALGITVIGSRVCVADKYSVAVIDVANPTEPSLYACSDVPVNSRSTDVVNSRLIVADGNAGIAVLRAHAQPNLLLGDFDGNDTVEPADLTILAEDWLMNETMLDVLVTNLNDDITVNLEDYAIMATNWLKSN